jgi:hypothetical protein
LPDTRGHTGSEPGVTGHGGPARSALPLGDDSRGFEPYNRKAR